MNIKVTGPGQVSGTSSASKSRKAGGDGGFSKLLDAANNDKEVTATSPLSKISAVNFIQAVDSDEKSRRRQLADEGDELLDELTNIRNALLLGNLSAEKLRNLQARLDKVEANCDDPKLNDIIEEIKIRAAVELAKLGF